MPVSPFSRYRNLSALEIVSPSRGKTRALPVRRLSMETSSTENRSHQFTSYETADSLALKYFGREELYWALLDANKGKLPDDFEPGETLTVPSVRQINRIQIPGR